MNVEISDTCPSIKMSEFSSEFPKFPLTIPEFWNFLQNFWYFRPNFPKFCRKLSPRLYCGAEALQNVNPCSDSLKNHSNPHIYGKTRIWGILGNWNLFFLTENFSLLVNYCHFDVNFVKNWEFYNWNSQLG